MGSNAQPAIMLSDLQLLNNAHGISGGYVQPSSGPAPQNIGQHHPQQYQAPPQQYQQAVHYQTPLHPIVDSGGAQYTVANSQKPTLDEADHQPWRYRGYPAMCKWMASDNDFFVLRRFGQVAARVLLRMQDRIAKLEEDLRCLDQVCMKAGLNNGTFRYEPKLEREDILDELCWRLEQYQRFYLDHSQMKARPDATDFQISNVKRWIEGANIKVIQQEEQQFLEKAGDLVPIVPKDRTPLRRFIDRFKLLRLLSCFRERKKSEREYDPEDFERRTTVYDNDPAVDKFVTCATIFLGLGMLIGPLWWLQQLANYNNLKFRLAVITAFLMVFAVALSILTVAKPFDVLAASAAYGAVLMVFMQLGSAAGGH
ncbi:hypothetical protein N7G274_006546 [Stereocaulon virgatum]|uniref:DUF6594 domain-containing protein n=1 Tax=Stereocaulon virgatum TaxID=373712 RepID=A0ABR4A3R7_9LECA